MKRPRPVIFPSSWRHLRPSGKPYKHRSAGYEWAMTELEAAVWEGGTAIGGRLRQGPIPVTVFAAAGLTPPRGQHELLEAFENAHALTRGQGRPR